MDATVIQVGEIWIQQQEINWRLDLLKGMLLAESCEYTLVSPYMQYRHASVFHL